jgi:release factor glutamine methyltransferase
MSELGPPWTILKLLTWTTRYFEARGIDSARLEAELLLSHTLGLERIMLYARFDQPLEPEELTAFRATVKRRAKREPIAYITGSKGFWTLELKTDARALIPRPDTEALVEKALERLPEGEACRVVDVGTGTGAIALSLASERPEAEVLAVDVSEDALALARENAEANGLSGRVAFAQGDLLEGVAGEFDVIVSNPPYVAETERGEMDADVLEWEPELALFAGEDGLAVISRLVPMAREKLKPGGSFLCEIGYRQGPEVVEIFEANGFTEVGIAKDLGSRDRVVFGVAG